VLTYTLQGCGAVASQWLVKKKKHIKFLFRFFFVILKYFFWIAGANAPMFKSEFPHLLSLA
jgi:hypothetical protein